MRSLFIWCSGNKIGVTLLFRGTFPANNDIGVVGAGVGLKLVDPSDK